MQPKSRDSTQKTGARLPNKKSAIPPNLEKTPAERTMAHRARRRLQQRGKLEKTPAERTMALRPQRRASDPRQGPLFAQRIPSDPRQGSKGKQWAKRAPMRKGRRSSAYISTDRRRSLPRPRSHCAIVRHLFFFPCATLDGAVSEYPRRPNGSARKATADWKTHHSRPRFLPWFLKDRAHASSPSSLRNVAVDSSWPGSVGAAHWEHHHWYPHTHNPPPTHPPPPHALCARTDTQTPKPPKPPQPLNPTPLNP